MHGILGTSHSREERGRRKGNGKEGKRMEKEREWGEEREKRKEGTKQREKSGAYLLLPAALLGGAHISKHWMDVME